MSIFKKGLPVSVAILIAPFSAAAQQSISPTIDGIFSVSYGQLEVQGTDIDQEAFMLDSKISISDSFAIGLDADHINSSLDEQNDNISVSRFQIEPTYHFGNNFYVGGFIQRASIFFLDFNASGLFAGFEGEKWSAEVYAGESDMSLFFDGSSPESSLHGVSVSYSASENLEIAAHVSQANLPDELTGGQHELTSVAAFYNIGNGFSIHGALEKFDSDATSGEAETSAIGVGYNFAEAGINMAGSFMLEAKQVDYGFFKSDGLYASWVVPFGKQTAKPLDSATRNSSGDIRTPFVAFLSQNPLLGLD